MKEQLPPWLRDNKDYQDAMSPGWFVNEPKSEAQRQEWAIEYANEEIGAGVAQEAQRLADQRFEARCQGLCLSLKASTGY